MIQRTIFNLNLSQKSLLVCAFATFLTVPVLFGVATAPAALSSESRVAVAIPESAEQPASPVSVAQTRPTATRAATPAPAPQPGTAVPAPTLVTPTPAPTPVTAAPAPAPGTVVAAPTRVTATPAPTPGTASAAPTPVTATPAPTRVTSAAAPTPPAPQASPGDYKLGPGDELEVYVWRQPELSRRTVVRPDGKIGVPLLGDVEAEGLTPMTLKRNIQAQLSLYLDNPDVSIMVFKVRESTSKVTIQGTVVRPGVYPLDGRLTIVELIAHAGGFTQFAQRAAISIFRQEGGATRRLVFNYTDFVSGKDLNQNLVLSENDIVIVP